jgi:hypothetical protein
MSATVIPAPRADIKAVVAESLENVPTVAKHFGPSKSAPIKTKIEISMMAVLYLRILAATPVPKIFAESLLPSPQPKKIPLKTVHILCYPFARVTKPISLFIFICKS